MKRMTLSKEEGKQRTKEEGEPKVHLTKINHIPPIRKELLF